MLIFQGMAYLIYLGHNFYDNQPHKSEATSTITPQEVLPEGFQAPITQPIWRKQQTSHSRWAPPVKPPGLDST